MAVEYRLYVNVLGAYIFDKQNNVLDKSEFSESEGVMHGCEALDDKIDLSKINVVKKLIKKYPDAELLDKDVPIKILGHFTNSKCIEKIRTVATKITKKRIAGSLKPDQLIVQAVNSISEIDKVANNLSKRLREWYELTNPELSDQINNHKKFAELILKKRREELLKEVGVSEEETMGVKFASEDMLPVRALAQQIRTLFELRDKQEEYVKSAMGMYLPNVNAICGHMIGAKLLAIAGSLERMMSMPASTIQLLGAESALFRHMKTGAKPPKYGVLVNHPFVINAKKTEKGKTARVLADKIALAVRIDYFKGDFKGDVLKKELEEKFRSKPKL